MTNRDRQKRKQRRAAKNRARYGKPRRPLLPPAQRGTIEREVELRSKLQLPSIEDTRRQLDEIITAADEYEPQHKVSECVLCAAVAKAVDSVREHALANGETSELRLDQGWGRDLIIIEQLQAFDWAREGVELIFQLSKAGHAMRNFVANASLREALAEQAHSSWAGWMSYMLPLLDGPDAAEHRARWERQMATPYAELTDEEKQSDLVEADRYLEVIMRNAAGRND